MANKDLILSRGRICATSLFIYKFDQVQYCTVVNTMLIAASTLLNETLEINPISFMYTYILLITSSTAGHRTHFLMYANLLTNGFSWSFKCLLTYQSIVKV